MDRVGVMGSSLNLIPTASKRALATARPPPPRRLADPFGRQRAGVVVDLIDNEGSISDGMSALTGSATPARFW